MVSAFGVTILAGIVAGVISGVFGADLDDPPSGLNIGLTYFQDVALVGAALVFARMAAPPTARDFGLRRPASLPKAVGLLVAVWVSFYALSALWVTAMGIDSEDDLPEQLGVDETTAALILVLVLVTVMAPIAEEVFFRGYFFTALRNWRGMWPAAILTGIVFGGIHAGSSPIGFIVPLAIFGIGLCLLYHWSGSLYPCIALHALNNSVAFGVTQDWDWQIPVTMAGSVVVSLALAAVLARRLGGARRPAAP
jgi:membrane protease YdiL (CAAX protease family)